MGCLSSLCAFSIMNYLKRSNLTKKCIYVYTVVRKDLEIKMWYIKQYGPFVIYQKLSKATFTF